LTVTSLDYKVNQLKYSYPGPEFSNSSGADIEMSNSNTFSNSPGRRNSSVSSSNMSSGEGGALSRE